MNVHKRTRLNLLDRREIWRLLYQTGLWKVTLLAEHFRVSRPGIYPRDSTTAAQDVAVWSPTPGQGRANDSVTSQAQKLNATQ